MSGKGQRVGYAPVSSDAQNEQRQLEQLVCDKVFVDHVSGKDTNLPALAKIFAYVREGDTIVVCSMDRLARNLDDPRKIVQEPTKLGIQVQFH